MLSTLLCVDCLVIPSKVQGIAAVLTITALVPYILDPYIKHNLYLFYSLWVNFFLLKSNSFCFSNTNFALLPFPQYFSWINLVKYFYCHLVEGKMKHRIDRCSVFFFSIYSMSHSHKEVMPQRGEDLLTFSPWAQRTARAAKGKMAVRNVRRLRTLLLSFIERGKQFKWRTGTRFHFRCCRVVIKKSHLYYWHHFYYSLKKNTFQTHLTFYAIMKLKLKMNNKNQIDDCKEVSVALRTTKPILPAPFLWHLCCERNT